MRRVKSSKVINFFYDFFYLNQGMHHFSLLYHTEYALISHHKKCINFVSVPTKYNNWPGITYSGILIWLVKQTNRIVIMNIITPDIAPDVWHQTQHHTLHQIWQQTSNTRHITPVMTLQMTDTKCMTPNVWHQIYNTRHDTSFMISGSIVTCTMYLNFLTNFAPEILHTSWICVTKATVGLRNNVTILN